MAKGGRIEKKVDKADSLKANLVWPAVLLQYHIPYHDVYIVLCIL